MASRRLLLPSFLGTALFLGTVGTSSVEQQPKGQRKRTDESPSAGRKRLFVLCNPVMDYSLVIGVPPGVPAGWSVARGSDRPEVHSEAHKRTLMALVTAHSGAAKRPGGCGLNAARAAGLYVRANGLDDIDVGFFGCSGCDRDAMLIEESCKACGVAPHLSCDPRLPTGACAVAVNEATRDRTMLCERGAAAMLTGEMLSARTPAVRQALNGSSAALFAATSLNLSTPARAKVVSELAAAFGAGGAKTGAETEGGAIVSEGAGAGGRSEFALTLGIASALATDGVRRRVEALLPRASLVVGNRAELASLAQCRSDADAAGFSSGVWELAARMRAGGFVVVTDGAGPVRIVRQRWSGEEEELFPVLEPVSSKEVVATTGAGDSFAGCFMAAYLSRGMDKSREALGHAVMAGMRCSRSALFADGIQLDAERYVHDG